jgi:LysM repeat protein
MMYGVDVSDLKKLNGLTDTALTPGQRLKVPVAR